MRNSHVCLRVHAKCVSMWCICMWALAQAEGWAYVYVFIYPQSSEQRLLASPDQNRRQFLQPDIVCVCTRIYGFVWMCVYVRFCPLFRVYEHEPLCVC